MAFRIFIVDDDPTMSEMIKDFLETKYDNAEISIFQTGEKALLDLFKKPDVVVLDYHLDSSDSTAMNGLDILKRIKDLLPNVPVIFLSSQENPQIGANTIKYGAYDYIVKNETAFHRLEIMINNSTGHMTLRKELGVQKTFNIILVILLIAVILTILLSRFF